MDFNIFDYDVYGPEGVWTQLATGLWPGPVDNNRSHMGTIHIQT